MSKQAEAVNLLRTFSAEDLQEHLRLQRRRLFEVRFQQAAGQVENHRQVRELRREIARTMTIQLELARGHHLVSELEVAEAEPEEEQPRPRRFRLRRGDVEAAAEPEPQAAAPVAAGEVETGEVGGGEVEEGPEVRPRRLRRRRESAAATGAAEPEALAAAVQTETTGEDAEVDTAAEAAEPGADAPGPDEEQADE